MNMRCRSPELYKSKGTTNSHTGNGTSTSLCITSSPSFSSLCRGGGEGEGPLRFPVLWVSFPTPPLWFPALWFHVLCIPPAPPVCQGERPGLGRGGSGGGGGHTMGGLPRGTMYVRLSMSFHSSPNTFVHRMDGCMDGWMDVCKNMQKKAAMPWRPVFLNDCTIKAARPLLEDERHHLIEGLKTKWESASWPKPTRGRMSSVLVSLHLHLVTPQSFCYSSPVKSPLNYVADA